MDEAIDKITPDIPLIVITASYEGEPPDNAAKFVEWLKCLTEAPFSGCCHAVYGCGNRDWVQTFQRIPKAVDNALIQRGSTPLIDRDASDAANNNIFNEFDQWADQKLWPALAARYGIARQDLNDGEPVGYEVIQNGSTLR